jgi:hypothetical protein
MTWRFMVGEQGDLEGGHQLEGFIEALDLGNAIKHPLFIIASHDDWALDHLRLPSRSRSLRRRSLCALYSSRAFGISFS